MSQSGAQASRFAAPTSLRELTKLGDLPFYAIILSCFLPLLSLHFRQLWLYEHYQYFPFLLIAFPFVIARNRVADPEPRSENWRWDWVLILSGLAVLALATLSWSPNLAAVAFVLTSGGILAHFYQMGYLGRFLPVWFPLFFLVKLPLNMDVDLVFWLQGITSQLASRSLDFLGINHFLAGHSIRIADVDFAVAETCSGIQSLFSLLAMTALILALFRRSFVHSLLLLVAAAFWACMINVVRVATIVVAYESFDIDLTAERPHEFLGLVLFALAIGLLVSNDRLLLFFTADDTMDDDDDEIHHFRSLGTEPTEPEKLPANPIQPDRPPHNISTRHIEPEPTKLRTGIVASFLFLGVAQLGGFFLTSRGLASIDPDDPRLANLFHEETLPASFGIWTRKEFSTKSRSLTNYQGRNSAQWVYDSELGEAVIGVDYPFLGWHELTGCYVAEGCGLNVREVLESDRVVRATMTMQSGANARLIFSEFTNTGQSLLPLGNDSGTLAYWRSRMQSALLRQFASFQRDTSSFQVQLLYYFDQTPSDSTESQLLKFQQSATEKIVAAVMEATSE